MKCDLVALGSLCKRVVSGGTPKSTISDYYNGGIPWLNTKEVHFNRIYETEKTISELGLHNSSAKWISSCCIIIAMYGATAGNVAINLAPLTTNQACCNLEIDETKADYRYIYYYLKGNYTKLSSLANGGAQQNLNTKLIKDFSIAVPSLQVQSNIADILWSIDDKIELNNKINENLEQQAQAIFRSWFLDCLPFNSIKPTSWKFCTLGETTKMSAGGDKPRSISSIQSTEYPYPIYSNGLDNEGLYGYTDEAKIFAESVTVSARGTIGFVCLRHVPYVPIVRLISLIPNESMLSAKYLYLYLKQLHISGTGTTQQQLTVPDFQKTEIIIPDKAVMDKFTNLISPIFNKIWTNKEENIKIASLRDSLLPKLMSGELDVSEIQL